MGKRTFEAQLERQGETGTWTCLVVPFSVQEAFGKKGQVKVAGTLNGVAFRSSLMPRGDGTHYMVVNKAIREVAGADAGSTVQVVMQEDLKPRTVKVPADLRAALAANPAAKAAFDKFPPSHKKECVSHIEEAKRPETRAARIEKTLAFLLSKE